MSVGFQLLVIGVCMLGTAFFSGIETGVISIHRIRLRHLVEEGSRRGRILKGFLDQSDRLLGTTLVGTNICVVVASIVAASVATSLSPAWGKAASSIVMTMLLLTFCEYLPKTWFRSRPLERCRLFADPLQIAWQVLRPLSAAITWLTRWLVPKDAAGSQGRPFVTREDLKILTRELGRNGVISPKERVMIHRVFELSSKTAADIMIPRDQMKVVSSRASASEVLQTARDSGLTRLPVHDAEAAAFVGVINILDVLSTTVPASGDDWAADYMRAPQFIPHDMPVDDILPRMRLLRQPLSLVLNHESQVVGLVTTEDVLEEIVGQL
jgi:putative hemolysin